MGGIHVGESRFFYTFTHKAEFFLPLHINQASGK